MNNELKNYLKLSDNTIEKLNKLNIYNLWDLIFHIPIRYEDETHITPIKDLQAGYSYVVEGIIIDTTVHYSNRKQLIVKITDDNKHILILRFIHFHISQQKQYTINKKIRISGLIRIGYFGIETIHPKIKNINEPLVNDKLTPIYSTVAGLNQKTIISAINKAITYLNPKENLPDEIIKQNNLPTLRETIDFLHYPTPEKNEKKLLDKINFYKKRLIFDELMTQQISMAIARIEKKKINSTPLKTNNSLTKKLLENLNFELTNAQKRVFEEIKMDLAQTNPMNRLLQGDVGSGKTIIAALASLIAVESNFQVAITAPTEILAEQHYNKFKEWFDPLQIEIAFISSGIKTKDKNILKEKLINNNIKILIGTHAIFQDDIIFANLGLIIVDEQHRFGVAQRLKLKQKGLNVHQLMMSATPIPRTLTMSYFSDLDISIIDEMPKGRIPIITKLINSRRKKEVEDFIYKIYLQKQQIYWVCPLIEESDKLQLETAINTTERLRKTFPNLNIGLIHGKLKSQEKNEIMLLFKDKKIDILVATSVIEVGIDAPNASLIVIENAERIGLSQLHQLRGRVGRGNKQGICILLYKEPLTEIAKQRLKVIYKNTDGFEIAKRDLEIRGPGELLGIKQSGAPLFKFADLSINLNLLEQAIKDANLILRKYPYLINSFFDRWEKYKANFLDV